MEAQITNNWKTKDIPLTLGSIGEQKLYFCNIEEIFTKADKKDA